VHRLQHPAKYCRCLKGTCVTRRLVPVLFSILFTLLVLPSVSSADPFSATLTGTGQGKMVSGMYDGQSFSVWAGEITWDAWFGDFVSYCLQIDSYAQSPQYFQAGLPNHVSADEANRISYLFSIANVTNNWMAAGLQLAIWNVIYDNDFSVYQGAGSFYSYNQKGTEKAVNFAELYLSQLAFQKNPTGTALFLDSLSGGQDQVSAIPEPATLLLFGVGAAALAARRRLKQNN